MSVPSVGEILDDVSAPAGSTIEQRIRVLAAQLATARRERNAVREELYRHSRELDARDRARREDAEILGKIGEILGAAGYSSTAAELGPAAALQLFVERHNRMENHFARRSRVLDERSMNLDQGQAAVRKARRELDERKREIDSREHAVRVEEERLAHNLRSAGSRANQISNPSLAADAANSSWVGAQPAGKWEQETATPVRTPDPLAGLFRDLAAVFERWSR